VQQLPLKASQPGSPLAPLRQGQEPALELELIKAQLGQGQVQEPAGSAGRRRRSSASQSQSQLPLLAAAGPRLGGSAPLAIGGLRRNLSGPLQQHLLPGSLLGERCGAAACPLIRAAACPPAWAARRLDCTPQRPAAAWL
jgi:hypothetical protein